MSKKGLLISALCILGLTATLWVVEVSAQSPPTPPKGITVSPALQRITIKPEETQKTIEFKITNNRTSAQTIKLSTNDFNSLNETGGLLFLGANPTQIQKKYGLSEWITLPQSEVTVSSKQTVTIRAQITDITSLPAGGHYGALMLALVTLGDDSSRDRIALRPIASSLLFVIKQGGESYKLKLTNVSDNHSYLRLPNEVKLRFKNEGNTHLVPRGVVLLTDSGGKLVKKGVINEDSGILLPENARLYNVKLRSVAFASKPGKYSLTVDYRFEGFDGFRTYKNSFFVASPSALVIILGFLLVIGLGYFGLRKIGINLLRLNVKKRR
ncbi:DUF916 domain-containing protein [Candidatus Saccharibacteria bacterium]|nr:DUF916 domain-containing protein [Candidatus Saccharibacteria bacterium]